MTYASHKRLTFCCVLLLWAGMSAVLVGYPSNSKETLSFAQRGFPQLLPRHALHIGALPWMTVYRQPQPQGNAVISTQLHPVQLAGTGIVVVIGFSLAMWWARKTVRDLSRNGECMQCGYDRRYAASTACPECGDDGRMLQRKQLSEHDRYAHMLSVVLLALTGLLPLLPFIGTFRTKLMIWLDVHTFPGQWLHEAMSVYVFAYVVFALVVVMGFAVNLALRK